MCYNRAMDAKICTGCNQEKPLSQYANRSNRASGKVAKCKDCVREYARDWKRRKYESNPDWRIDQNIKARGYYGRQTEEQKARYARSAKIKKYGITEGEYDRLFSEPGCAICLKTEPTQKGWQIDHDHETGKVRGLLCSPCNLALGQFGDNMANLERAIAYLEVHHRAAN